LGDESYDYSDSRSRLIGILRGKWPGLKSRNCRAVQDEFPDFYKLTPYPHSRQFKEFMIVWYVDN